MEFIRDISRVPNFSPTDVVAFHNLPHVPYLSGVYEVSRIALSRMINVSENTVGKFFDRLEESQLVDVLRRTRSGRYSGIAFIRKELGLHKKDYSRSRVPSPSRTSASSPGPQYILYPESILYPSSKVLRLPQSAIELPKNFFRPRPNGPILSTLTSLLGDSSLSDKSVFYLLNEYILTESDVRHPRRHSLAHNQ